MRREAGAVIVLVGILLAKLPGFIRDYRWSAAVSHTVGAPVSITAADRSPAKSTSQPDRSDSSRSRLLSAQSNAGGESSRASSTFRPNNSSQHSSSVKVPSGVPRTYLEDPLGFLSTAPPESLLFLPGIGPVLAERIAIAAGGKRPFTRWEDLLSVKGIGPKKLERLKQIANTR